MSMREETTMANSPLDLSKGIVNKQAAYDKKYGDAYKKYVDMGYDPATSQMKANVEINYDNDFQGNYDDYSNKTFDKDGLITEYGRNQLKAFLDENKLTTDQVMKLSNKDFNELAKKVQDKYGIDDFELAQEFLVTDF